MRKQSPTKKEVREFPAPARGRGVQIAPSLLSADFANLRGAVTGVRSAGCKWLHLDIMDGHFVPNITFGPPLVKSVRAINKVLYLDCHLMIDNPREYVKPFVEAGAQLITFHVEAASERTGELLQYIHRQGIHAGLSIRPKTPVSELEPYLPAADLVLVMTVEPGFGGQKLIPSTLNKVRELTHLREKKSLSYLIQVDGGINQDTAPLAVAAGSDVLVAGSSIFGNGKIKDNILDMRRALGTLR